MDDQQVQPQQQIRQGQEEWNQLLCIAAANDFSSSAVVYYIRHGAHVNCRNEEGLTPLHVASYYGCSGTVLVLLGEGGDVTIRSRSGRTALHFACIRNQLEIAKLLVNQFGSNVDARCGLLRTPLIWACAIGHWDIVAWLIVEKQANVNARDYEGRTALHFAAQRGHEPTVKLVLTAGASILATANSGDGCLRFARSGLPRFAQKLQHTIDVVKACQANEMEHIKSLSWPKDLFVQVSIPGTEKTLFQYMCDKGIHVAMVALIHTDADVQFPPSDGVDSQRNTNAGSNANEVARGVGAVATQLQRRRRHIGMWNYC